MKAAIAIGTNLGQRQLNVARSLRELVKQVGPILRRSRVFETKAVVPEERAGELQPDYLNAAVLLETSLGGDEILTKLLAIERNIGREREKEKQRWSSRILDLDLICLEGEVIESERLRVPHPEMHKRLFVLEPMLEVWPDWRHPVLGRTAAELYESLRS